VKSGERGRIKDVAAAAAALAALAAVVAPWATGERIVAERDALSAVLPVKLFLARAIEHLAMPWWNPAPTLGKPFFADPLPGTLYPGNLLLAVPPFARGYGLFLAGQVVWTAAGAWLCLRASGLPRLAALTGALVWALGGGLVSLANVANHLSAAAWLPWVLWAWSRPRSPGARVAWSSLAMAPVFLAGSPEMAALVAAALLVWSSDARSLLVPVLAAGVAAVEVVPIAEYARETLRGVRPLDAAAAMRLAATPAQLGQLVHDAGALSPPAFLRTVYVGPIALGLALVAWSALAWRRALALAAAAAVVVLVALGPATPVLPALFHAVPLASLVRYPGKALVGLHALVALGSAFGLARVCAWLDRAPEGHAGGRGGARRAVAAALPLALAVAAVVPVVVVARGAVPGEPASEVLAPPPIATAILADAAGHPSAADPMPLRYFANTTGMPQPSSPAEGVRLDRELLFAATGELYGLANVNTPSSLNLVAHEVLQKALVTASRESALSALAALGTRYATTWVPFGGSAIAREVAVPGGEGGARLYRLEGASARAFVARRIAVAGDAVGAVGRFALSRPGNHRGLAVIEERDAAWAREQIAFDPGGAPLPEAAHEVRWIEAAAARLALEVTAETPSLLVVNDTWAPGWTATVDGVESPLLRVNGLVRGVVVPAGRHAVEMRYRPPGLRSGLLLSLASALVLGLLLGLGRARPPRAGGSAVAGSHPSRRAVSYSAAESR
jgi:hypothetical protein